MYTHTLILLALGATTAFAKTDLAGCTSTATKDAYGAASMLYYVPGTGEICAPLDCGGGRAPPKTTVPGCAAYSGTATYSPSFLANFGAAATSSAGAASTPGSAAVSSVQTTPVASVSSSPAATSGAAAVTSAADTTVSPTTPITNGTILTDSGNAISAIWTNATTTTSELTSSEQGSASAANTSSGAAAATTASGSGSSSKVTPSSSSSGSATVSQVSTAGAPTGLPRAGMFGLAVGLVAGAVVL